MKTRHFLRVFRVFRREIHFWGPAMGAHLYAAACDMEARVKRIKKEREIPPHILEDFRRLVADFIESIGDEKRGGEIKEKLRRIGIAV